MVKMVVMVLAAAVFFLGCYEDMEPFEAGDSSAEQKVLIAAEDTDFKRKVVDTVLENLGTGERYFRIIGLSQLKDADTDRYEAVVLISAVKAGKLDGSVKSFLENGTAKSKTVLFITAGGEVPVSELKEKLGIRVDAVSSASRDNRLEAKAEELKTLLERLNG